MTDEIASLGIVVDDGGSVERSKKSLASLAEQGGKTEQALGKLGDAGRQSGQGLTQAASNSQRAAAGIGEIGKQARSSSDAMQSMVGSVKALAASYVSIQGVRGLLGVADEYTKFNAQLRLATRGMQEYGQAYENVIRIARGAQSEISSTGVLYARLNNALRDMGASQQQVSDITETVSLSLRVSGASAAESASAMLQLSQAFGSGVLRGEEFNAVNEAAPGIMRALADSIGVPIGALRELASEGKLTSDVVGNALKDPELLSKLREQAKEVRTVSSAWVAFKNEFTLAIGEFDKATGATRAISSALQSLSQNIGLVGAAAAGTTTLIAAMYAPKVLGGLAVLRVALAGLSLPVTAATLAVTGLTAAYVKLGGIAGNSLEDVNERIKRKTDELKKLQNTISYSAAIRGGAPAEELLKRQTKLNEELSDAIKARIALNRTADAPENKPLAQPRSIKAEFEGFSKDNPLKDLIARQEEYAEKIRQVNEYEKAGLITVQEASRYRKQFTEELSKGAEKTKKAAKEQDEFTASLSQSYADLTKQLIGLNAPQETQAQILERMLGTMPHITQAYRDWAQAQIDIAKDSAFLDSISKQQQALDDQVESIRQQALAVRDETAALGMLPSQITRVTVARLEDRKAMLEGLGLVVPEIEAQIAAYRELADAQGGKEMREAAIKAEKDRVDAAKDAAKEIQREHERMSDNINRSLTDALLRGFESGKSFAENFRDTLKNMFRALVLQPVVKFLVDASGISALGTGLVSMLSGGSASAGTLSGAGGSVGDAANLLGVGKNLYSAFTGGLDKLGATVTGSIQDLGVFLSNGNGGLADTIGGFLGQNSAQIANGLAYLPSVISLIRGDIKGAAFSVAGTALGSLLGPGGAIVGGAIGSLVGGLFGKDKPKRYGSTASGTYSGGTFTSTGSGNIGRALGVNSGLAGLNEAFAKSLGGLLSAYGLSDTVSTSSDMISRTNLRGGFYSSFDGGSVSYGNKFGKAGKVDINAAFQQMVAAVMGQTLVDAIQKSKLPEGIRALFSGFTDQAQVQSLISSVTQLNRYQADLTKQYNLTADSAAKVAKASGLAGQELIDFVNKITSTTLSLRTPGEAVLDAKSIIQEQLDAIIGPVAFPETIKAFDAMLKGIDTSTGEGISQFAGLFGLRDAVAEFLSSLGNIKTGVTDAIFGLKTPEQQLAILQSNLAAAFGELGLSVPKTVAELIALGESIDFTTEEGLNLAAIFPSLVEGFLNTKDAATSLASSFGLLDINRFKNLVDYTRAQRYAVTGNLSKLPSFDIGTNIVPKDMVAKIHEGERIIPAADNRELMQRLESPAGQDLGLITAAINRLESVSTSMAKNLASLERRVRKWDGDGMPPERMVTA